MKYLRPNSYPLLVIFFFALLNSHAQNRRIDSLKRNLTKISEDTDRVTDLLELGRELESTGKLDTALIVTKCAETLAVKIKSVRQELKVYVQLGNMLNDRSYNAQALDYLQKALEIAANLKNEQLIALIESDIGDVIHDQGNYKKALEYQLKAFRIYRGLGDKDGIASTGNNLATNYEDLGDYAQAQVYYDSSLEIFEQLKDKIGCGKIKVNLGNIYNLNGNYARALTSLLDGYKIFEELGEKSMMAATADDLGITYLDLKDYAKALEYYSIGLKIYGEIGNTSGMANIYGNMGLVYDGKGDCEKGLEYHFKALKINLKVGKTDDAGTNLGNIGIDYYTEAINAKNLKRYATADSLFNIALAYDYRALAIFKKNGDKDGEAINLGSIGSIFTVKKDYAKARAYLDSSLALSKSLGEKEYINTDYHSLFELDSTTGNYKKSIEDYELAILYRDSMVNEETTKKTIQAEMNAEFEKKEAVEKTQQEKKDIMAAQEQKREKIIIYSLVIGFTLALALVFLIFRSYRQKKIDNEIISTQKALVEEKQNEILGSIHYAQRIQKAMLASEHLLETYLLEYFVVYKPKDIVSGDFYWAAIKDDTFYLAVCDSTGHGVPGAFMSLLNISYLNEAVLGKSIIQPNEVFNFVRKKLIANLEGQQDGMDGVLLSITPPDGLKILSKPDHEKVAKGNYSAAFNAPVIIRDGAAIELNCDKIPIGRSPSDTLSFNPFKFEIRNGDMIYLFTDGFGDQFGGSRGKKFKYSQFKERLIAIGNKPLKMQKEMLEAEFENWKGNLEQVDDVLILGIRV